MTGITSASPGRIQEFKWDFEIEFKIDRISKELEKRIYLPPGSMILVQKGLIKRIWRPKLIPSVNEILRDMKES